MKMIVRLFALTLVATGAYASSQINQTATPVLRATSASLPVPMCPPNDPNACHICDYGGCYVSN